jgi:putative spermidine/putrescine transport system permease protein
MRGGPSNGRAPVAVVRAWMPLAPFVGFVGLFLLWPAVVVFRRALEQLDAVRAPMLEAITGQYGNNFAFSLRLSALTALLGVVIGTATAVAVVRLGQASTTRNLIIGWSAVAANLGGLPLAFAFIAALGKQGLITRLLSELGIDLIGAGFDIAGFWGIVLAYLYFQFPLMTLVMVPAIEGLRASWRESAANLGADTTTYWRLVGLPILAPPIISGFLLLLANAFSAYATAYALSAGGSRLIPVQIRFFLQGNTITGKANLGYALAAWMIIVMVVTMGGFLALRRRAERWRA